MGALRCIGALAWLLACKPSAVVEPQIGAEDKKSATADDAVLLNFSTRIQDRFSYVSIEITSDGREASRVAQKLRVAAHELDRASPAALTPGQYRLSFGYYDDKDTLLRSSTWCDSGRAGAQTVRIQLGANDIALKDACRNPAGEATRDDVSTDDNPDSSLASAFPTTGGDGGAFGQSNEPATGPAGSLGDGSANTEPQGDAVGGNDGGGIYMIGDSLFTHGDNIHRALQAASSLEIANHAVLGAWMRDIASQYQSIRGMRPRIVIMDGGGNDVLGQRQACSDAMTPQCRGAVDAAIDAAKSLWSQMAQDGVRHVVYMQVYYPEPGRWNPGTSAYATQGSYTEAVNYAYTRLSAECAAQRVHCVLADPRPALQGMVGYTDDGVHPSAAASGKIAEVIWQAMQRNNVIRMISGFEEPKTSSW